MAGEKTNQLLGEYLIDTGFLNIDELREAATIARNQNLPIGKVLVMSGYLSKELLETTVELQSRVRDGQLEYKMAVRILDLIGQENITIDKALERLKQAKTTGNPGTRLGELLAAACLISDRDLYAAQQESRRCGLPLGRVLVNLRILSQPVLNNVLGLQSDVRNGKLTKEEAIQSLVAAKDKQFESHPSLPNIQETPTSAPQPNDDAVSVPTQEPVKRRRSSTKNRITGQFKNLPSLSLHHMLRAAGILETAALEKAITESLEDPEIMTAILRKSGLLEDFVIEGAKQCCQLIGQKQLKPEQAIIALHQCQRTRTSLQDCLLELGWLQPREAVNL